MPIHNPTSQNKKEKTYPKQREANGNLIKKIGKNIFQMPTHNRPENRTTINV